jgi:hypothetical protein
MRVTNLSELPEWAQKQLREKLNLSPSTPNRQAHTRYQSLTEKAFMQQVVDLATLHGWLVYHTYDSRRSSPGFPDLVMVKGNTLLFAELKTEKGKLSQAQGQWLEALSKVETISSHIWKPSDWQEIEMMLKG